VSAGADIRVPQFLLLRNHSSGTCPPCEMSASILGDEEFGTS
jgi:hypothetical protein